MTWECFADRAYFDMWCVREVGNRRFGESFHLVNGDEARGLVALLNERGDHHPAAVEAVEQKDRM